MTTAEVSLDDYSRCLEEDDSIFRRCSNRVLIVLACGLTAVAFCRFALLDFWGALVDALVSFVAFLSIYEFHAVYYIFCSVACGLDCCLNLGSALFMWLGLDSSSFSLGPKHSALICASASLAGLGMCVCLVLWADLRVNNKREGFGARHLMYGSVMEVDAGGKADPFLLQENGQAAR
ncbi:unnamed protein product [Durusdinium trenchii]|uniref:Transmembrane protein n=1 Tax=Durusdinium trenchii TaxID=1381693 RepID=A0ABP0K3P2_9DINO